MAVTRGGGVYTWGKSSHGQLGLGNRSGALFCEVQVRYLYFEFNITISYLYLFSLFLARQELKEC